MEDRRISKNILTTPKEDKTQGAHSLYGGTNIHFEGTVQTKHVLIHEDGDIDNDYELLPCNEPYTSLRNIGHLYNSRGLIQSVKVYFCSCLLDN
jgi:hypothetical protein